MRARARAHDTERKRENKGLDDGEEGISGWETKEKKQR